MRRREFLTLIGGASRPAYTAEADWTAVTSASGPHLMMSGTNAHSGRGFWALASDKANIEDSADRRR